MNQADDPGMEPRTDTELMLAKLFSQALQHERFNVDDNFFELGGNSLTALRLANPIRAASGVDINIAEIFAAPTIAGLAKIIDAASNLTLPPVTPMLRHQRLPLSPGQGRLWSLYRLKGPNHAYNVPLVWRVTGSLDTSAFSAALADVVARHESLRTIFGEHDGIPFQQVRDPEDLAGCLMVERVAEEDLVEAVHAASRFCFDLTTDVPIRSWLFHTEPTAPTATLVLVLHHIAVDEWSMRVLLRDLSEAYAARHAGAQPSWPKLLVQYADYTLWQRRLIAGQAGTMHPLMQADLDFWAAALADAPADATVPTDHPYLVEESERIGATCTFEISVNVHRELLELVRACDSTLFVALHAAVSLLLRDFGSVTDLPIGVQIAGRDAAELDDVVGLFVNTVILRADVSGEPTFRQLVTLLTRRDEDAFSHSRIPFDKIADSLKPQRAPGRSGWFQVMMGLAPGEPGRLTLADVDCVVAPADTDVVKCALDFTFFDTKADDGSSVLSGRIQYDSALFDAPTIETLAARLVHLLGECAARPDTPLTGCRLRSHWLEPGERSQALLEEPKFLRSNVIIEPLVDRFYAWLHSVAPTSAALNLAFMQLPLLESYLNSPELHVKASNNPKLRGGFFVNIPESRAQEVRELADSIKRERAEMLRFAAAIRRVDEIVRAEAAGFDLSPLYAKLPTELSGLVELTYDQGNQPSMRFIEPLAYKSLAYCEARQSVQLSVETGIERPFIMSTPRLPAPDVLDLPIPFRHPGLEQLFLARIHATTLGRLRADLELDNDQAGRLGALLADQPDLPGDRHIEHGCRIRYFGHACLVFQTPDAAIITDPWVSADNGAGDRFTYRDLPDHIDLALITHGHQDHVVLETLLQLRGRVGAVVVPRSSRGGMCDPSLALYLSHVGLPVVEVDDFSVVDFPGGRVTATPFLGEHGDLDIRAKSTYCVELPGRTAFVGADSSGIDPVVYRYIRGHVGRLDMAFLGMECNGAPLTWLYQALLTRPLSKEMSDSRRLSGSNAAQAEAIMTELGVREAAIYAMGEESWLGHIMATSYTNDSYQLKQIAEFMDWCADRGVKSTHLYGKHEWRW